MNEQLQRQIERVREAASNNETILGSGFEIWTSGGWAMIALAGVAMFIFLVGLSVFLRLRRLRLGRLGASTWRIWIHEQSERSGLVGAMFDRVDEITGTGTATVHDAFDEIRAKESAPFRRDLRLMKVAVGAAPLVGLLGTVTGMLATFDALGSGSGGDQTMAMIAKGISEALYTTETGLVVALPTLFFHYYLSRRFERFRHLLRRAESVWAQDIIEGAIRAEKKRVDSAIDALARQAISARVLRRLEDRGIRTSGGPKLAGGHA